MTEWILIFAFWASTMSKYDAVSMTSVTFTSEQSCQAAGRAAKAKFDTMMKTADFVCVKR